MLKSDATTGDQEASEAQSALPNDRNLLDQIARGEDVAFRELYNRYSVPIYNYLFRLLHQKEVAEDLLQEVFLAVWKGAAKFRGRSSPKTWLFKIAHHQAVSWLRKNSRFDILDEDHLPAYEPGLERSLSLTWEREQLFAAMDQLSANHRAVIELVFVNELSYQEVAAIMDCPIGTVKSRMSYALAHLNRLLNNIGLER